MGKKESKKQVILNVFNSFDWIPHPEYGATKTIDGGSFLDAGLNCWIEYGEKYSDIHYAKKVIQALGHRVLIGHSFHVYKDKLANKKNET